MQQVILVNEKDESIGVMDKMEVHEKGLLHRAFSIFIFNAKGEMLLQQRAADKYHSANLWTNACCSHPNPGEKIDDAAHRRLKEELGFDTTLIKAFDFTYQTSFDNGLIEHEYDHVYTGIHDGEIHPDKEEVKDHCFMPMKLLAAQMSLHPHLYTAWFKIAFPMLEDYLARKNL
ncbi:MAG: isopentenyl-diphosphate Delta-isomerase [Ferruginibacter sp.]